MHTETEFTPEVPEGSIQALTIYIHDNGVYVKLSDEMKEKSKDDLRNAIHTSTDVLMQLCGDNPLISIFSIDNNVAVSPLHNFRQLNSKSKLSYIQDLINILQRMRFNIENQVSALPETVN
ncbi:hypothetical protein EVB32_196 [Rhizobium phage RHph_TM39]|uniref:Uncharacterized protein n=2 Tax=Cuauhnahuacvirus TaxID=3044696 RepID=A0A7S5RID8_9CAUD|nr:hypothetical protein PQC16_gp206 [Rhizobium phage RHph_TM30]YP_010671355.1 hypothetical protein PQC17_gp206 [Rhizobium phage RHph_Y65]QIG71676.1 hypothetical protein EVB94_205 [Rhizobium phage RHph_TM40]QIG72039.1 hypothetical protein EVB95_205 [Rhizobium phage RHph_TM2_3B]QIG72402.1 hypothetical protein EVB96_206 [Rhizobium phage RHph_TM3_3_6]QIG77184.1 hypothetical protein EVB32_196 [Rhizobium phage RHph_TM39]QIG77792.1 hypothetical protein EVB64_205 [Rhizobium phage RHph_TM61]